MSTGVELDFDQLPENSNTTEDLVDEGIYILKIEDITYEDNPTYGKQFQFSYSIVGTPLKINFDNSRIFNADGTPNDWGRSKLRQIIESAKVKIPKVNLVMLQNTLKGKFIKAKLKLNDKGYPNINFADIFPMDDNQGAENTGDYAKLKEAQDQNTTAGSSPDGPTDEVKKEFDDNDL